MSIENITTIGSLLREVWRYEPDILKLIFEFLFVPRYEDKEGQCRYVIALTIPGTTTIGYKSFSECEKLQLVTIHDSVTIIGYRAFQQCSSLKSVTIPNSVTTIGNHPFSGCSSLQSVTIPNSVTTIGNRAFSGCSSLQSVTIPNAFYKVLQPVSTRLFLRSNSAHRSNQSPIPNRLQLSVNLRSLVVHRFNQSPSRTRLQLSVLCVPTVLIAQISHHPE